jgi:large subunit ribosomal protein L47
MTIGEKPTQEEILRSHVKNWKSLNIRQRRIILGFLNARRSKDAKASFVKELKILGQKIAYEEAKERSQN